MDAESAHIEGLKVSPCRPAPPARMPPAKK
jgi:hypothetical protein